MVGRAAEVSGLMILWLPLLLATTLAQAPSGAITGMQAKNHVGQQATVCGKVASTRYLDTNPSRATFLNLDKPNPEQTFTVVIFGDNREKFDRPEIRFKDKQLCITGRIVEFRGSPQIIATEPSQIKEVDDLILTRIHSSEVASHLDSDATVCGFVASVRYDTDTEGKPIFLNFDRAYPDQTFTAVIYDDVRNKFGEPEARYVNRTVCVTGRIERFQTFIRMVLTEPKQIVRQQ